MNFQLDGENQRNDNMCPIIMSRSPMKLAEHFLDDENKMRKEMLKNEKEIRYKTIYISYKEKGTHNCRETRSLASSFLKGEAFCSEETYLLYTEFIHTHDNSSVYTQFMNWQPGIGRELVVRKFKCKEIKTGIFQSYIRPLDRTNTWNHRELYIHWKQILSIDFSFFLSLKKPTNLFVIFEIDHFFFFRKDLVFLFSNIPECFEDR